MDASNENLNTQTMSSSSSSSSTSLNELKPMNNDLVNDKVLILQDENAAAAATAFEIDDDEDTMMHTVDDLEDECTNDEILNTVNQLPNEEMAAAASSVNNNQTGLQKLLNKQKMELACELRRLQYANRPVSNTDSKNRLEQFFTEAVASSNDNSNGTASTRPVRDPTQFRSAATLSEIQELVSQQRVSNVLQTARQRLESALQRINASSSSSTAAAAISTRNLPIPTPPPINQLAAYTNELHHSQASIASTSSNIVIQSTNGATNVFTPVTAWVPVATPPLPQNGQWLTTPAVDPLRTTIDQVRREQIIEEISELVHQQLVTSTLESEFRTRLEDRVMRHLQNSGIDGNRTREYVRNIAQNATPIERNDFSHLGIFTGTNALADNLDSASSYQGSSHVAQQQQQHQQQRATASNTREIRALKSEISELKSMMKLSFELQLDMQRSLRQEISALIAGTIATQTPATASNNRNNLVASSTINSTKPANEGSCIICTEGAVDTVLYKCGHMCTCYSCSMTLKQTGRNCPVCRAPINDILRTYKCNLE